MKDQDCLYRFLFEDFGVRGEWVRLRHSWQQAKQYQNLPDAVAQQLGQALAAVVLLSATIKFKGSMILQAQGDGKLRTLVAQATDERTIRGLARFQPNVKDGSLSEMMGQGRLVLTVESALGEPYQGLVALAGNGLADVLTTYFKQSEQLETRLWLFANQEQAVGLFLQQLPSQNNQNADWERLEILANTVTATELFNVDCENLVHRLFHEEKLRLFEAEAVRFACQCSREKIANTLITLNKSELDTILQEQGQIQVNCEFCAAQYVFGKDDMDTIFKPAN